MTEARQAEARRFGFRGIYSRHPVAEVETIADTAVPKRSQLMKEVQLIRWHFPFAP